MFLAPRSYRLSSVRHSNRPDARLRKSEPSFISRLLLTAHSTRTIHRPSVLFAAHLILSLTFFNDHEGDVVILRHALSEFLNGFQELRLERVASRGGFLLNDF
jgi:hypothetical protein